MSKDPKWREGYDHGVRVGFHKGKSEGYRQAELEIAAWLKDHTALNPRLTGRIAAAIERGEYKEGAK